MPINYYREHLINSSKTPVIVSYTPMPMDPPLYNPSTLLLPTLGDLPSNEAGAADVEGDEEEETDPRKINKLAHPRNIRYLCVDIRKVYLWNVM